SSTIRHPGEGRYAATRSTSNPRHRWHFFDLSLHRPRCGEPSHPGADRCPRLSAVRVSVERGARHASSPQPLPRTEPWGNLSRRVEHHDLTEAESRPPSATLLASYSSGTVASSARSIGPSRTSGAPS